MYKQIKDNIYITVGIQRIIPPDIQMLLLDLYNNLEGEKDYLQVYLLKREIQDGKVVQIIRYKQEVPEYNAKYILEYNDAVNAKVFLQKIAEGKDREVIAKEVGYKNYKSMDMFLRRNGYHWDKYIKNYALPDEDVKGNVDEEIEIADIRARQVIKLFSKGTMDVKQIAKEVGFIDHKELAEYMRVKGFKWDAYINNYVKNEDVKEIEDEEIDADESTINSKLIDDEFINYLKKNEIILRRLIEAERDKEEVLTIPKFIIKGVAVTKSIYMKEPLAQLITDYSKEKKVNQNQIVEVALIEFFKKYGYKAEVELILKR